MAPYSTSTCRRDPTTQARILLVEFDEAFRTALAATLRDDDYTVVEYRHPAEVPPQSAPAAGVVIGDCLPSHDGLALADRVHAVHPHTPIVICSTYATPYLELEVARRPHIHLLRKPIDYAVLAGLLELCSAREARDN
jgi:two-component system, NtrC family, response regulator AtoC